VLAVPQRIAHRNLRTLKKRKKKKAAVKKAKPRKRRSQ